MKFESRPFNQVGFERENVIRQAHQILFQGKRLDPGINHLHRTRGIQAGVDHFFQEHRPSRILRLDMYPPANAPARSHPESACL